MNYENLVNNEHYWLFDDWETKTRTIGQWDSGWTQGDIGGCFWIIGCDAPCYYKPEEIIGAVCLFTHNP